MKNGLKTTAAHVFDEVIDEVRNETEIYVKAVFDEKTAFDKEVAFDKDAVFDEDINETSAIWMLMITDNESFDVNEDVATALTSDVKNEADFFVWWFWKCLCSLILLANLTEQRLHAKISRRAFSSIR